MVAIFQRLQSSCGAHLPLPCEAETRTWDFKEKLQEQHTDFFIEILQGQGLLSFEYDVCCAQLAQESLFTENHDVLIEHLIVTLMMAEMLEHLYTCYLYAPSEIGRLRRDQGIFRTLLMRQGYQFHSPPDDEEGWPSFFIRNIGMTTTQLNFPRVLMTRIRQLLNSIDRLVKNISTYHDMVVFMNAYAGPVLSHLVWIFFTPRLLINLGLAFLHTIPNPWMTVQEAALGWQHCLAIQWNLRWFELANDAVWVTVGLGNCFILVGTLTPFRAYLTLIRHVFDVILVILRACLEINRMNNLQQTYYNMLQNQAASPEDRNEISNYLSQLENRLEYESHRHYARIISAAALLLAIALTMPILASIPMISFIGATLAVLITVFSSWLEPEKPTDYIMQLNRNSLFRASPRDEVLILEYSHNQATTPHSLQLFNSHEFPAVRHK